MCHRHGKHAEVWYDGDPEFAEPFEERCRDYFYGVKKEERENVAGRIKGNLFGDARLSQRTRR